MVPVFSNPYACGSDWPSRSVLADLLKVVFLQKVILSSLWGRLIRLFSAYPDTVLQCGNILKSVIAPPGLLDFLVRDIKVRNLTPRNGAISYLASRLCSGGGGHNKLIGRWWRAEGGWRRLPFRSGSRCRASGRLWRCAGTPNQACVLLGQFRDSTKQVRQLGDEPAGTRPPSRSG